MGHCYDFLFFFKKNYVTGPRALDPNLLLELGLGSGLSFAFGTKTQFGPGTSTGSLTRVLTLPDPKPNHFSYLMASHGSFNCNGSYDWQLTFYTESLPLGEISLKISTEDTYEANTNNLVILN